VIAANLMLLLHLLWRVGWMTGIWPGIAIVVILDLHFEGGKPESGGGAL
jgi:hypothetical protein